MTTFIFVVTCLKIRIFVVIMINLFAIRNLISLIILVEGLIILGETKG